MLSPSLLLLLMQTANSLEKTLMLGKIEGKRRRGWQRMGWPIASLTRWTCTEQTLGDGEGKGSQACCSPRGCRGGHDLETEQPQTRTWTSQGRTKSLLQPCLLLISLFFPNYLKPEGIGFPSPARVLLRLFLLKVYDWCSKACLSIHQMGAKGLQTNTEFHF